MSFVQPLYKAMGIESQMDGYGPGGEEIKRLRVNGALALFFFANQDQVDLSPSDDEA
jgi:hypothetical protein